ncbi:MAG: type IVB secretion system coupling complex protein DotM/IcmP [Coxiellaceae bacterium]|nr:type IVB secretion system coupling complex protein DotM/IcmP [Coxiellaceae bacterium]
MNPNSQNQTDHTANFFWLIVLIAIALVSIWYFIPKYIVTPVFLMRYFELDALIFLSNLWNSIAGYLHLPVAHVHQLIKLKQFILTAEPSKLHFTQFSAVNAVMGHWVRWPTLFILGVMGLIAYFRHSTVMFRETYNMDTLKDMESENWPQIQPVLSLNLVKEDIEKGPWAMAKTPLDYCRSNDIVSTELKSDGKTVWKVEKGPASRLFTMQLGPLWKDIFNLPIHIKALMVVFIARAERERDVAKHFLSQISASAASGKLDFTGVNEQLIKYQNSKLLQWLRPRHAYVRTMMATLLEMARADGVLATAEFLWLKPVDRKLWYTLNSVGRQTSVVEVSGIFSHWKAEKALGRAMTTPMVKEAVRALDICMQDILYVGAEERWHSRGA